MFHSRLAALAVVCLSSVAAVGQTPQISGLVNAASFQSALAPGSQATLLGTNMGPNGIGAQPTDPSISVGGRPAYIYFASAQQVSFQVPVELSPGPATLILTYQGRPSAPFAITLLAYAPAILTTGSGPGPGAFQHVDGSLVGPTPAQPGETLLCIMTGLGPTNPPVRTGQTTPGSPQSVTVIAPTVSVSGKFAQVQSAVLLPQQIGTYQVNFTVPGDLAPGLYSVVISVAGVPSAAVQLPVAINGLVLDRTGIAFDATVGGPAPPSATLVAFPRVAQPTTFVTAKATTTRGGTWLTAILANGSTVTTSSFNITVRPDGLLPGVYYGQVKFETPDAPNSPQLATIVLRMSSPGSSAPPLVDPAGVTFVDVAGSSRVTSQTVTLTNVGTQAAPFTASTTSTTTPNPFSVPGNSGNLAPGVPLRFTVQANTTVPTAGGIGAGSYRGTLTFTFPQGARSVDLLFLATPAGACKAVKLFPVFRSLGPGFTAQAGWPQIVEVNVLDECGIPMANGSVVATFSNGDAPLALVSDGAGKWSATWTPANINVRPTIVTVLASQPDVGTSGQWAISGSVADNPGVPIITPGGVVDAASFNAASTPSPGQIIGVFGAQFASDLSQAPALPLPTDLNGTQLVIAGRSVPLIFTSPAQINAVLPYGLSTAAPTQMVAIRGNSISTPVPVAIVAGSPGVFATGGTGRGQGHVYVATGGAGTLADSNRPLKPGDVIIIYCGGLGEVDVPVEAGTATPVDKLRNAKNAVTLTIGGVRAAVSFAGLTPGASGLYQVNATVPVGVPSGAAVPVVLTMGAVSSLPVMVAVQ